jgi:dTDP-4-dehydrorhamnose reductase
MKILVTGASGYVGAGIYAALKENFDVTGTYNSYQLFPEMKKLDITNSESVNDAVGSTQPDVIVHAAAIPSPSQCDKDPDLAFRVNHKGTENIVNAAKDMPAGIIYISTQAVKAPNLYGRTKLAGENCIKKSGVVYTILRPSLTMGLSPNTKNDRPFNRVLQKIDSGTRTFYADDSWEFQPTWLRHLAEVTDEVINRGIVGETIPVCVPEPTTKYEMSKDMLRPFNIHVRPANEGDSTPVVNENLDKLDKLGLPSYSYGEMIDGIVEEIKKYKGW